MGVPDTSQAPSVATITQEELRAVEARLRQQRVLTVYVSSESGDPAMRSTWRTDLRRSLADIRTWLADSPHEEREGYRAAAAAVTGMLREIRPGLGAAGMVVFATAAGVQETGFLAVAMPTVAVWSSGPCIAPLVRAMKEARSVILAVTDARRTRLYRYRNGAVERLGEVRAFTRLGPPLKLGQPASPGFHAGTQGRTGRDAMQRARMEGQRRMLQSVTTEIREHAGGDAWVVVAGETRSRTMLAAELMPALENRVAVVNSPGRQATDAGLARIARRGASQLREAANLRLLEELSADQGRTRSSVIGHVETERALSEGAVRELLFTHSFLSNHLADTEAAIRSALSQGALVEEVSGAPAARLDELGGIAARLRYSKQAEVQA